MHIDQLTAGNWTRADATAAVEAFCNAPAYVDKAGAVLIHAFGRWVPVDDADLPGILAQTP
jgi:hypothetical protein